MTHQSLTWQEWLAKVWQEVDPSFATKQRLLNYWIEDYSWRETVQILEWHLERENYSV